MGIKLHLKTGTLRSTMENVLERVDCNPHLLGKPLPFYLVDEILERAFDRVDLLKYCSALRLHTIDLLGSNGDKSIWLFGGYGTASYFGDMFNHTRSRERYMDLRLVDGRARGQLLDKGVVQLSPDMTKRLKWAYQQIDKLYPILDERHTKERSDGNYKYSFCGKRDYYFLAEGFFLMDAIARETAKGRKFRNFKPMTMRVDAFKPDVPGVMNAKEWIPADCISYDAGCDMYFLPLYPRFKANRIVIKQGLYWRDLGCFPGFVLRIKQTDAGHAWAVGFSNGFDNSVDVLKYGRCGGEKAKEVALRFVKEYITNQLLGESTDLSFRCFIDGGGLTCYKLTPVNCTVRERVEALDKLWNAALRELEHCNQYKEIKDFYANLFDHTPAIYLENCHEKD